MPKLHNIFHFVWSLSEFPMRQKALTYVASFSLDDLNNSIVTTLRYDRNKLHALHAYVTSYIVGLFITAKDKYDLAIAIET